MSVIIQGYQLRTELYGVQVLKAAQNLPQTATANLSTVTSGGVMINAMIGVVTTAIGGACNLSLGTSPTTGTAANGGIASASAIGSQEAGTMLIPLVSAGVGGALVVGAHAGNVVFMPTPFVVQPGYITWTTSTSVTGQIKWYIMWTALDNGASLS